MIPKISRGSDPTRLMKYLFGWNGTVSIPTSISSHRQDCGNDRNEPVLKLRVAECRGATLSFIRDDVLSAPDTPSISSSVVSHRHGRHRPNPVWNYSPDRRR